MKNKGLPKENRLCMRCKEDFKPSQGRQKYCGSKREKEGCAWIMRLSSWSESQRLQSVNKSLVK